MSVPTTVTLVYSIAPQAPMTLLKLQGLVQNVPLGVAAIEALGLTQTSDVTNNDGTNVIRTITFAIQPAYFSSFPAMSDLAAPLRGVFLSALGGALASYVVADEPNFT